MKLITFYSNTHKELHDDFFLKSANKFAGEKIHIESHLVDQSCPSGDWYSKGWLNCMSEKLVILLRELEVLDDSIVIYSDCDVIITGDLFDDIHSEMNDYDIKFQDDGSQLCAGFFAFKKIKAVRDMLKKAHSLCSSTDDQSAINSVISNSGLSYSTLDFNKYHNVHKDVVGVWEDGMDYDPGKNTLMFHANFTVGVENKKKLLSLVLDKKGICL